jgi:predicted ABC-type exoprotein transport system permease subunit
LLTNAHLVYSFWIPLSLKFLISFLSMPLFLNSGLFEFLTFRAFPRPPY